MTILIRAEQDGDHSSIRRLLVDALGEAEAALVEALRLEGALLSPFVAVERGTPERVIGYVAASQLLIAGGQASALAPLAVAADHRRRGLGARLVDAALKDRRSAGDDVMLVLGDADYYGRFGFAAESARRLQTPWDGPHQQAVIWTRRGQALSGRVAYAAAFTDLS